MKNFTVNTKAREELVDITPKIEDIARSSGVKEGVLVVFIPHTTAGVVINENADPAVKEDIIKGLGIVPKAGYSHAEGNSPAHIKSSLVGQSVTVLVSGGRLKLGTWQGICLAEFDGPRQRTVWVKVI